MNYRELKNKLYGLVNSYFSEAIVVWGRVKMVRPPNPLICLTSGSIVRHYQPITQIINGVSVDCYPSSTTVQVDLFTHGHKLSNEVGAKTAMENTAVNDLTAFVNFINSAYTSVWCEENDISILTNQIHDLTELINDAAWDYRAMVELEIGFTQLAVGYAGIMYDDGIAYYENGNPIPTEVDENGVPIPPAYTPSPSGGGSQELANQSSSWFEQVEIKEEDETDAKSSQ